MSRYTETRKRICTGRPPLSDAEIIEELAEEIDNYRDQIVRQQKIISIWKEDCQRMSEENEKLRHEKKVVVINSDTLMTGRTNGKHMHQMIDEILSIPANRTVIRIYANSDRVPTMSWEINGHPYNDNQR